MKRGYNFSNILQVIQHKMHCQRNQNLFKVKSYLKYKNILNIYLRTDETYPTHETKA